MRIACLIYLLLLVCFIPVDADEPELVTPHFAELKRAAMRFLATRPDAKSVRFLSFAAIPEKDRADRIQTMQFWINNLHFQQDVELLQEVPATGKVLWWFLLDDYGWNQAAWDAVSSRDPYRFIYEEPAMHQITGSRFNIVRADLFFRDTVESERNPSYYDLLFASKRFRTEPTVIQKGERFYWPGGNDNTGKFFAAGWYTRGAKYGTETIKQAFPKDETQWETEFGADLTRAFIRRKGIDIRKGAVVDEGLSIVTRQNRLIESFTVPLGYFYKTFDVDKTSGNKDFIQTLHKGFQFDAGEIIASLPAGGQAYLLVDGKGNIIEVADNKFAIDRSDLKFDSRVRTPGSCVICHESGIIKPVNAIEEILKSGIRIKSKDKQEAREARAFFLHWDTKLKADQERYAEFVKRTSGWEPGINASKFKEFRDWYDSKVTAKQAAIELGMEEDQFKTAAIHYGNGRIAMLIQGMAIPRGTWESLFPDFYQSMKVKK